MRNVIFLFCRFFLVPGFVFQAVAQGTGTSTDQEARPVRIYPEDAWMEQALDNQISDLEMINYLYGVLTHHDTNEGLWEDSLNTLIFVQKRSEKKSDDAADIAVVNERIYHVFSEVIADFDRTKGQRYDVLGIIGTSGDPSAVRVLRDFVKYRPPDDAAGAEHINWDEERELRSNAIGFLEDIGTLSAHQALQDLVLYEALDDNLKEQALDSLKDEQAYDQILQLIINDSLEDSFRSDAYDILVDTGNLAHIQEVALAPSAGQFALAAVEELAEHKAVRMLREITLGPHVARDVKERAFLKHFVIRKDRKDRRQ